jgi:hypothetical protein
MKNRILIYEDRKSANLFEQSCIDTMNECNSLIELFENFQPWQTITTHADWLELVTSPQTYFDTVLLANVKMSATDDRKPDPGVLAQLFNIDRENWLNITSGKVINESECKPCKKLQLKRGRTVISLSGYISDKDYLIFDSGLFSLNTDAIEKHKLSFNTYLENEKQSEYYTHCKRLAEILNQEIVISKLGPVQIQELAKIFGLQILDGRLILNDRKINDKIKML